MHDTITNRDIMIMKLPILLMCHVMLINNRDNTHKMKNAVNTKGENNYFLIFIVVFSWRINIWFYPWTNKYTCSFCYFIKSIYDFSLKVTKYFFTHSILVQYNCTSYFGLFPLKFRYNDIALIKRCLALIY